jgi:hypothetical protein
MGRLSDLGNPGLADSSHPFRARKGREAPKGEAPGGGRKAGSAHLTNMHDPVPKGPPGGSQIREALLHVNYDLKSSAAANVDHRRWIGVAEAQQVLHRSEVEKKNVCRAWCPGGKSMVGNPAAGSAAVARGPYLGFKNDYHKQGNAGDMVKPGPGDPPAARMDEGVRPYRGVNGIRMDYVPVWEMKKPQKPGPWQPNYPKCHGDGPQGRGEKIVRPGQMRIGPDPVGPIVEFKQRRVDLRPHALGHDNIDAHRIGVFPAWPHPPYNDEDFIFDPDRPKTVPADPEDRSRAAPAVLNARRSAAVKRLFMTFDPMGTGKIEIRQLLAHLRPQAFKNSLDPMSRVNIAVSPDDLDEHLRGLLTATIQQKSKDVRIQTAFMPSAGCRAGRLGTLAGKVSLIELQDIYAALGCHVFDDGYFEELLEHMWDVPPRLH